MRIGIDLGGTKIEGIVLGPDGSEVFRRRIPTPAAGYSAIVDAVCGLVATLERDACAPILRVGIGIPGTISPATDLVKNANTTALLGHPLHRDLSQRLGRPVRVANDANCFALSEASDGAGARPSSHDPSRPYVVFAAILGTGVGAGVVVDGKVLVGPNGIAGEWGHSPLPWPNDDERPGPACYCGKSGCLETWLSGPGLSRDHERRTGVALPAHLLVENPDAQPTIDAYEDRLARGLATIVNVLDPDVVVLGGGLSNLGRLYTNVAARWGRYIFSDTVATRLVPPRHGDSSGVRGAAWLWPAA